MMLHIKLRTYRKFMCFFCMAIEIRIRTLYNVPKLYTTQQSGLDDGTG
jgi:hypothetical protein